VAGRDERPGLGQHGGVAADVAGLYDARILGMIVWFVPGVGAAMA
jgi:hypothetical protein